jgi:predicted PurR-regulated permease PerM
MPDQTHPRIVGVAAFLVALAAGMYVVVHIYEPLVRPLLDVLPPFVIAMVFAFVLDPVVDWVQRRGGSRGFGVALVGVCFLLTFLAVGFFLVPRLVDQAVNLAENLPEYSEQVRKTANSLLVRGKPFLERLNLPTSTAEWTQRFSGQAETAASRALSYLAGTLSAAFSKILWVILIPLSTLWLLKDLDYLKAKIVYLAPPGHQDRLLRVSSAVGGVLGRYVRGMLTVAILFSVVTSIVLSGVGLDYALVIGGISGLFYLVPYIGVATLAAITGVAALVQPGTGWGTVAGLVIYLFVQSFVLFDLVITPRVVGGSVGVHPVLMLFSLALGARLFGVVGMVAAVPVAAACQVALGLFCPRINDRVTPTLNPKQQVPPPDQEAEST